MPDKKYLDEIEEILRRAEVTGEKPRQRQVPRKPPSVTLPSLNIRAVVSPGKLMIAGVAVLVLAMILRPFYRWLTAPLLWVGLASFIVAYVLFLVYPRTQRYEKRWRGRLIEEETSLWERIRRSLRRF